jgi:SpoVK/Ycf46/Vps4 family AAA+-type ATPase
LTTFLTCLSGFGAKKGNGIKVIIGATNRPWALDSALVRGKRFDTHVYVGLPDYDARHFLVKKAFKGKESLLEGSDLTIEALTDMFDGYSGADISAIMGKIKVRALERALDNRLRGEDDNVPVTMADAKAVLADYRNSVTPESLLAFEAFKNGEL